MSARTRRPRRPPGARAVRATVRFAAAVFAVSGSLLIADATLTFAWQEPISAVVAKLRQDRLAGQLPRARRLAAADARALAGVTDRRARLAALARRHGRRTVTGDALGRVRFPTLDRAYVIARGDDPATLRGGPGHYPDTPLPGQGGTVAVAGHRTTYLAPFRSIDRLRHGQPVVVEMPYGRFVYRVTRTLIVRPQATWVKRRTRRERLVLTACHPLYSASKRIVVFATLAAAEPSEPGSRDSNRSTSATSSASDTTRTAVQ